MSLTRCFALRISICQKGVPYGLKITLYDCLGPCKTIFGPKTFPQLKLVIFDLLVAFLAFMAFKVKNMAMAECWGPKGPKKPKKFLNFDKIGWWPSIWPSKIFWPFSIFWGGFDA